MGYTHFSQPVGTTGVYVGAKGSEKKISDGTSVYSGTAEVNLSVGNQIFVSRFSGPSTALEANYIVVPYATKIVAAYGDINSGTVGTGALITMYSEDTAGTALGNATFTSAGTAGQETVTFGSLNTATVAALSTIAVVKSSCATAYGATVTLVCTKAGN